MLLAAAFAVCFAGGLVPFVNSDVFLVGLALLTPWHGAVALIVVAVAGQLAGRIVVFIAVRQARGRVMRLLGRPAIRLAVRARAVRSPVSPGHAAPARGSAVMFVSAAVGLPPFAATTVVAASAGVPLRHFMVASGLGRTVRTAVIVLVPNLLVGG